MTPEEFTISVRDRVWGALDGIRWRAVSDNPEDHSKMYWSVARKLSAGALTRRLGSLT